MTGTGPHGHDRGGPAGSLTLDEHADNQLQAGTDHDQHAGQGGSPGHGGHHTIMEAQGVPLNAVTYPVVLSQLFGADAVWVQTQYPGSAYGGDYRLALGAALTDSGFACPTWELNRSLSQSTRSYAYEFADRTAPNIYGITPDFPLGAYHAAELPYLFPIGTSTLDPAQRHLSGQLLSYWTRFAAGGHPNGHGTPHWRQFNPIDPTVLTLDLPRTANEYGFDTRHHCAFWATIGP